jgi:6-phosphogluconate dehydrogenase
MVGLGQMGASMVRSAIDDGLLAPVPSMALTQRFASRGDEDLTNRLLSALRYQFGGSKEKP